MKILPEVLARGRGSPPEGVVYVLQGMESFNAPQQIWGVHDLTEEIKMLKAAQFEHAERLTQHTERIGRLEQQQDDSKIRSLWGTPSPFPPMLSSGSFSQRRPSSHGSRLFLLIPFFLIKKNESQLLLD